MSLETLDYDHNLYDQTQSREGDKNLAVRFYMDAVRDDERSEVAGRPIYSDVTFIEIRVRGNKNDVVQRPAHSGDFARFREIYRAFKDGDDVALTGTPLKEWGPLTKSLVMELAHMGFHTVEQLSEASDSVCSRMAGLQNFKQKAKLFIEMSKGNNAPIEKLAAENEALRNNNVALTNQMAEVMKRLESLDNANKSAKASK